MTKSGTGTWDWDSGTWDSGTRDAGRGTWDVGRGTRDAGRGTREAGTRGRGTWDAGTRGRDKQTTPEFVKYNFRWSREKCIMMESLSGDSTSKEFVEGKSTR